MTITNAFQAAAASLGVPAPNSARTCNMNELTLVDVFTTAKPCAAHAAAFENMSEAALNHLPALAHRFLADARSQLVAVRIDRGARLIVAMPTEISLACPRLSDPRLPWAAVLPFEHVA